MKESRGQSLAVLDNTMCVGGACIARIRNINVKKIFCKLNIDRMESAPSKIPHYTICHFVEDMLTCYDHTQHMSQQQE